MQVLSYILVGVGTGIFSGFFGLGGGVILIPMLTFLLGLSQHQAQGTSLAIMIPPIGILAAWRYYVAGNVKLFMAVFICIGFLFGGLLGAHLVNYIPDQTVKRIFGILLLVVALRCIFGK